MGVNGLLPFLKSISKTVTLSDLRGSTVAVDTYCWLHKAAICCSDKIALSQDTDLYLNYCLKYVNLLLAYNVKIILVFDGKNLPAKKDVEDKRRANRESNMKRAFQLVLEKRASEAKTYFDRCINITHDMAVKFIKQAYMLGVKCIVAPYEADAQLAFLGRSNIVDYIITDDSDLLLFGAPKVIFKLDFAGKGVLIEKKDLNKALGLTLERYSFDKFRYICIISGCDYYGGIAGVGLITATKMVKKTQLPQFSDFLQRINLYSTSKIILTKDDIQQALDAELTLKHQIVFDPIKQKQVPLIDYPVGSHARDFVFAGQAIDDDTVAFELACGKRNPRSQDIVPNFDLDQKLRTHDQAFYFGVIKDRVERPLVKKKTIDVAVNRSKSMVVRCEFPWKAASNTNISLMKSATEELELYTQMNDCPVVGVGAGAAIDGSDGDDGDDEAVNILKMVLDQGETIVASDSSAPMNPFSSKGLVRNTKRIVMTCDKENECTDSDIVAMKRPRTITASGDVNDTSLTSKKMVAKSVLGHLFKKL